MPVITIDLFPGRTDEMKEEIVKSITDTMINVGKVASPDDVTIIFNEVSKNCWAQGGKLISNK